MNVSVDDFLAPGRLWLLAIVPVLVASYVWQQRRRRQTGAVRFANLGLLKSVAPKRSSWRRHVPAAAVALSLTGLLLGFARPSGAVQVPKEAATVMLVIDTSASMMATDVDPSRLDAAITAAQSFVDDLPPQIEVGLVSFDRSARMLSAPTTDHEAVQQQIAGLTLGPGTAAGEALAVALSAIEDAAAADGTNEGAAIVLLSDGVTTIGRPVVDVAQIAADRGIPVSTIAFGTPDGIVEVQGNTIAVPADPDTMAAVAETTSGRFFEADSSDELEKVYEDIGTRVGYETQQRERSGPVLATSTILLVAALGLGLLWNGRLV
jgi:Ca-activated chloride channel family protein